MINQIQLKLFVINLVCFHHLHYFRAINILPLEPRHYFFSKRYYMPMFGKDLKKIIKKNCIIAMRDNIPDIRDMVILFVYVVGQRKFYQQKKKFQLVNISIQFKVMGQKWVLYICCGQSAILNQISTKSKSVLSLA